MIITITVLVFLLSSPIAILQSQTLPPYPGSQGEWQLLQESIGIAALHMQLLNNNKVIIFDRTDAGPSNLSLPEGRCRSDPFDYSYTLDCTAHSVLYDIATNTFRPLMLQTDAWCSSGSLLPNGTLVQTGGFNDGDHTVRTFSPCLDNSCDWVEFPSFLAERRWYASNHILPDGRIIIIGGRDKFTYEFYIPPDISPLLKISFYLPFLQETKDNVEDNLYPFVYLVPNGNLFIFANNRSILLDYKQNVVIKEFPPIPGGDPRNYPSTGSSVMLPLDEAKQVIEVEVMVCGGAERGSYNNGSFVQALKTCGTLKVTDPNPSWLMEDMPMPRVMSDMLLLPTGEVIVINGAMSGTAGWELGRDPVLTPVIYRPSDRTEWRFMVMSPASRPRMYHSSAVLLIDGRVLVGGSNPHQFYSFGDDVNFPTDLSLEAFSPPYMSKEYDTARPKILTMKDSIGYNEEILISFEVRQYISDDVLSIRLLAPSFTTHSFAMNQRMVVLRLIKIKRATVDSYVAAFLGPTRVEVAPPGYYMLFIVHGNIPSSGMWLKVG